MDQISNFSKQVLPVNFKKSFTKKRTTFWQMLKCIVRFGYKPSFLLLCTTIGAVVYIATPLSLFSEQPLYIRFIDDLFILFIFLKVLSHETLRFSRFKAKSRRHCDQH